MNKLMNYLKKRKHLPECINDFDKQSNLFRSMHHFYQDSEIAKMSTLPSTVTGHIYVIDWFLWFMATRGYKLQKIRTNEDIEFIEWPDYQDILKREAKNETLHNKEDWKLIVDKPLQSRPTNEILLKAYENNPRAWKRMYCKINNLSSEHEPHWGRATNEYNKLEIGDMK